MSEVRVIAVAIVSLLPAVASAQTDIGAQASAILKAHCAGCHGGGAGRDRGGFDHVLSAEKLSASGMVVKYAAADSPLYERVSSGEMPPRAVTRRPSAAEIATLRRWIAAGAPAPRDVRARVARERIGLDGIDRLIAADLESASTSDRAHLRYLTFAHLADAGASDAELALARAGVAKVLASLSWKARLPRPQLVANAIVRIDLRQLGWSRSLWDSIAARDPYALQRSTSTARRTVRLARTTTPAMRADWFAGAATRPPLYHRILSIPATAAALGRRLGVDRSRRPARAGFNQSGISKHNRIIERRSARVGSYFWRSYDFRGSSGRRSIFDHPLGPGGADGFAADGGEIIFGLPNGMQAYMLVDAHGRRIDKAPTDVVFDPSRPDGAVANGISCMGCHTLGIIDKRDEIRGHLLANRAAFDARDRRTAPAVLRLYRPRAEQAALFAADRRRFVAALDALGANSAREPITALANEFDRELDLARAAAELGVTAARLRRRIQRDALLGRNLGALLPRGGTLKRDVFAALFATVAPRLGAGRALATIDPVRQLARRCEDGDGRDCLEVGTALLRRKRRDLATRAFERACRRQTGAGCTAAAELLGKGRAAESLLDRGCRTGDLRGCDLLAARIERRDGPRARRLLTRSCDGGRSAGCVALGDSLARIKRHRAAVERYQQACDRSFARGCSKVAAVLERGRGEVRENEPRAAALFRQACDGGDVRGCLEAGELYYEGDEMPKKRALAAQLFNRACGLGSGDGCYHFAKQLRSGKGVRKDKRRAKALFAKACRLGKRRACLR